MVYRQQGKRVWYLKVPTRNGWKPMTTGVRDKAVAKAMERMIADLGPQGKREWKLLEAVTSTPPRITLGQLFDAYQDDDLDGLRARLADVDLGPCVARWLASKEGNVEPDTLAHYTAHIRSLFPDGEPFPRSRFTADVCDEWLAGLEVSSGTKRKYYTAASQFADYCVKVLKVLPANPLLALDPPKAGVPRVLFLETPDVLRLVESCLEPYRTLFAVMYGTGIEVSTAIGLRVRDVNVREREIHARGSKGVRGQRTYRDRIVRVAQWAWPYVQRLLAERIGEAPLFPGLNRWTVSDEHKARCEALGFTGYRLHDARHYWAVRAVRSGAPAEVVANGLGHADATMVHKVYGKFKPGRVDREKWEAIAALQDEERAKEASRGTVDGTPAHVSDEVTRDN